MTQFSVHTPCFEIRQLIYFKRLSFKQICTYVSKIRGYIKRNLCPLPLLYNTLSTLKVITCFSSKEN